MELQGKPGLETTLQRFDAWWRGDMLDRAPITAWVKPARPEESPPSHHATLREPVALCLDLREHRDAVSRAVIRVTDALAVLEAMSDLGGGRGVWLNLSTGFESVSAAEAFGRNVEFLGRKRP